MTTKIDPLNLTILQDLLSDGRKPFAEIAEENNVSKEVIAKRFKQLKAKGIVLGFTTQNSARCYSANFVANILLYVQRGKVEFAIKAANEVPNVTQTYCLPLEQNVLMEVALKNIDDLDYTKKLCQGIPYVLRTEVTIWTGFRNTPRKPIGFQNGRTSWQKNPRRNTSAKGK